MAPDQIQLNKREVEKAYNKNVRLKQLSEGDILQKLVLPMGARDLELGKWSLNWEGPFIISLILPNGAYRLVNSDGKELQKKYKC